MVVSVSRACCDVLALPVLTSKQAVTPDMKTIVMGDVEPSGDQAEEMSVWITD